MFKKNTDDGILILRLSLGVLMLFHGVDKIFNGVEGIKFLLTNFHIPGFIAYGVFIGEVIAPILIIIGYRARLAALIYIFNMAVAVILAHSSDILALGKGGGWAIELQALYILGALTLFLTGAGKVAISNRNQWD